MQISDQDMPLRPIAEQIRRRDFGTVRRGYDPQEVRAYLSKIAGQVGALERELSQLRLEAASAAARSEEMAVSAIAAPAEDPYDALSKRFATLIEMADQEAEKILGDARSEASRTLSEAASDADRIRVDAQSHAEATRQEVAELRERATTESDRVLSGLAERRRSLVTQLEEMRAKLIAVAEDFAVSVDEAVRVDASDTVRVDADDTELEHTSDGADDGVDARTPADSQYEVLWEKKEEPLEIPDLASLDLDLEKRDE
jgi:DivIVA domain-containing protein